MKDYILYHNPRCSKSREALALLQQHHIHPTIIEYLKTPLNMEQLKSLRAHFDLKEFVRTNEPIFKALKLSLNNEPELLAAMAKEPILMQRPIVVCGQKAIIARPTEKILDLWASTKTKMA
jgi:arsenate reductase